MDFFLFFTWLTAPESAFRIHILGHLEVPESSFAQIRTNQRFISSIIPRVQTGSILSEGVLPLRKLNYRTKFFRILLPRSFELIKRFILGLTSWSSSVWVGPFVHWQFSFQTRNWTQSKNALTRDLGEITTKSVYRLIGDLSKTRRRWYYTEEGESCQIEASHRNRHGLA